MSITIFVSVQYRCKLRPVCSCSSHCAAMPTGYVSTRLNRRCSSLHYLSTRPWFQAV